METKQSGEVVFCGDDAIEELQNQQEKEHRLPPYPVPLRPWRDYDNRYKGDMEDYKRRIHDKLFKFWALWGSLRTNAKLEELLARFEADKDADAYLAKNCIVDILCEMSKILADTDIVDELSWLHLNDEEFQQRMDQKKHIAHSKKEQECEPSPSTSSEEGSDQ